MAVRKPRDFNAGMFMLHAEIDEQGPFAEITGSGFVQYVNTPAEAERIANWLQRWARWAREKKATNG